MRKTRNLLKGFWVVLLLVCVQISSFAADKDFPERPSPPSLVNDMAHMMSDGEAAQLERKLEDYANNTSTQITIVTLKSLGDYDVSDYAIKLGKLWGVGKAGKNNGVVILASLDDHKINISTGKGLEGAITDAQCARIIRNEMVPAFKEGKYFDGFSKCADALIAASKGEYKGDKKDEGGGFPIGGIVIIVIVLAVIIFRRRGGNGGGGNYISGGGIGNVATGFLLGSILGGGRGGDWGGGGGDSGGGGFGGFGGGDFGGGGASGSW